MSKAPEFGLVDALVIVTVGFVSSFVMLNCVAAVLVFEAASCATPAATSTVTSPSVEGVIVAV